MSYANAFNDDRAYEQRREAQNAPQQQQPQSRRLTPAEAARQETIQSDAFLKKRYGQKWLDDRDAHIAAVAKSVAATKKFKDEAPARALSAELNRNQLQLERMLEAQRLSDIRMQLQTEKSDWNPGPAYVPKAGDTPETIQRAAEAAMKEFGELDRDAQKVLIGFLQANPCDLTNVAVWESAWAYICEKLTPVAAPQGVEPEPIAVVAEPEKNPHVFGSRDYEAWERAAYQKEFDGESAIFRQSVESLGMALSAAEVKSSYEKYLEYVQATAKVSRQPREAFNVDNVTRFLKQFFAGRDPVAVAQAAEYDKSLDAATANEIRDHVGVANNLRVYDASGVYIKPLGGTGRV